MKEEIIDVDERGNLLAAESTTNYGLIKPGQDDFYNVDDFNQNMDTIDHQLKVNESQIKNLESQIQNIDVSGDVRQVINERVNADTSKPLSTLISEWVNAAKTAILNGINGLPQKSVWTDARGAKLDNLNQSMTTTQTNMNNNTNAARDNIKNHMDVARDNIKNHITASRGGIKSVQHILVTDTGNVTISAVNMSKTFLLMTSHYGTLDHHVKFVNSNTIYVYLKYPRDFNIDIIEFY